MDVISDQKRRIPNPRISQEEKGEKWGHLAEGKRLSFVGTLYVQLTKIVGAASVFAGNIVNVTVFQISTYYIPLERKFYAEQKFFWNLCPEMNGGRVIH